MTIEGRCMRCKAKKAMKKPAKMTKTSRGGFMAKGNCSDCDCGMCAIMSKDNAEKAVADGEATKEY
jgi:hypothetical protein